MVTMIRNSMLAVLAIGFFLASGCGNEIGDSCSVASDCSSNGDRFCEVASPGGYCTIRGCEFDSCPGEAVCVRFFSVGDTGIACETTTEDISTDDCSVDEICVLGNHCVPRAAEVRFCMRKCGSGGDCRNGYECRDEALMIANGGEPVPDPTAIDTSLDSFCAPAPIE